MKKTININIKGNAFNIEEDAYMHLKNYLDSIRKRIRDSKEAQEVIDDIETRLAELFRASCKTTSETVTESMVQEVIKIMGEPKDIAGNDEPIEDAEEPKQTTGSSPFSFSKKMYRNPMDKVIAGVCGGLGYYFDISPVILRLIFVLLIFTGISPLVYIAFWIAMPEAISVSQRMEMMGPNYQSSKTNNATGESFVNYNQRSMHNENVSEIMNRSGRVLATIFGYLLAISSFLSLSIIAAGIWFYPHFFSDTDFPYNFFNELPARIVDPSDFFSLGVGILISIGIPLLVIFYWGISLIFNIRKGHAWMGVIAFIIWICGILMVAYGGLKTGKDFISETAITTETPLELDNISTLHIIPTKTPLPDREYMRIDINDMDIYAYYGHPVIQGQPEIRIYESDNPRIVIRKKARGKNKRDAVVNAQACEYFWTHSNSTLKLDAFFSLIDNSLIRNQEVEVDIYIPENIDVEYNRDDFYISRRRRRH